MRLLYGRGFSVVLDADVASSTTRFIGVRNTMQCDCCTDMAFRLYSMARREEEEYTYVEGVGNDQVHQQ
jgi:hypothetical protein